VTLGNVFHSDIDYAFKYFRYQITQFLPLILAAVLLRERYGLKVVAWTTLLVGVGSAAAAVLQNYDPGTNLYAIDRPGKILELFHGRILGFSRSPVLLATQLLFVLLPLLGLLASGPLRLDRSRIFLAAAAVVTFTACYFSQTRSALLGIGVGLLVIGLYLRGPRLAFIAALVVIAGLSYFLLRGSGVVDTRYYRNPDNDKSAAGHLAYWQAGFFLALENSAIGMGHDQFNDAFAEYASSADIAHPAATGENDKQAFAHNDFLNVWLSWGILAFGAYVALFVGALYNCAIAARSEDPLIRGLAVGCAGGLAGYAVHSAFHNSLDSSAFLWLYAGLSVALTNLATSTVFGADRVQRLHRLRAAPRLATRSAIPT
jgi:O-antigen ligase